MMKTVQQVLTECEARFDGIEARIGAFVPETRRWERLEREAAVLVQAYPDPEKRPPLYGLPVGVKDIFHVDGIPTRAGSRVPPEILAGEQADIVTRLKAAGALIIGKTVTTEFAYFAPGPTRNPANVDHTPGGSSSGSASAVAAGLVPIALGTQTIGSINRPAAYCGCIGYKPSYERISRTGVIPLSDSFDHVGFFADSLPTLSRVADAVVPDWKPKSVDRLPVLAVPMGAYLAHVEPAGMTQFEADIARLEAAGFTVKRIEALSDFERIAADHRRLMAADAAQAHTENGWLQHRDSYHWKTLELIDRGLAVSLDELPALKASRGRVRGQLLSLLRENDADGWIAPAAPSVAPKGLLSTGDPIINLPWTHAGLPIINVPTEREKLSQLPFSVQLIGEEDEMVMAWAETLIKRL